MSPREIVRKNTPDTPKDKAMVGIGIDTAKGLPLSYDWKSRLLMTGLPIIIITAALAIMRQEGWLVMFSFAAALWAMWAFTVLLKARAALRIDEDNRLYARRFFKTRSTLGSQVTRVTEIPNGRSPDIMLHTDHGKIAVAASRLNGGHSTLFAWLATQAPDVEMDRGAERVQTTLENRGLL